MAALEAEKFLAEEAAAEAVAAAAEAVAEAAGHRERGAGQTSLAAD
jgi:hypothetical protein